MIAFFKGFLARIAAKTYYIGFSIFLTAFFIFLAMLITTGAEASILVAYVGEEMPETESEFVRFEHLKEAPSMAEMVLGEYDVLVEDGAERRIESLKNVEYESIVAALLAGESVDEHFEDDGNPAPRIIGFALVVILLQSFFYLDLFIEDKKNGALSRMLSSPKRLGGYLNVVYLYGAVIIFVVTMLVLALLRFGLGETIGLNFGYYALLVGLSTLLGSAMAFAITAVIEVRDNAGGLYVVLVLLTSILSGSFGALNLDGGFAERVSRAMPQYHIIELAHGFVDGSFSITHLLYVIAFIGALLALSYTVVSRKARTGMY